MNSVNKLNEENFEKILMRNLTLPITFGLAGALFFVFLIFNLNHTMRWVEHTELVIGTAKEIAKLDSDMQSSMRGFLITKDESFLEPYVVAKPAVANGLKNLMDLVVDNPAQVERLKTIKSLQIEWEKFLTEEINLRRGDLDYISPVKNGIGKIQFDSIQNELDEFINTENTLLQNRTESSKNLMNTTIGVYIFFTLLISGFLAFNGRRDLLKLNNEYSEAIENYQLFSNQLEYDAWLKTGQAKLAELGLSKQSVKELSQEVLNFLAEYINLKLATFYLANESNKLKRSASYGLSNEALKFSETITLGEGLVGECVLTGKLIELNELPNEFFKINTSVAEFNPLNIIIVPVINNEQVIGCLELGFAHKIAEREKQLLELLADSIGISLEISIARQKEQDSLVETQQLNEELQVQQEELRSINEELDEQSRVLEESQVNLENQKAELEQNNSQLSEQADQLESSNFELKLSKELLESRAADLERASQVKSEFLANMSHELRTPLNSSLILAKMLADNSTGNLNTEQVGFANTIYSSGNDLLNLINDILDISKVEARKLDIKPEIISLQKLVDSQLMTFTPLAQEKNLVFTAEIAPNCSKTIFTDQQRLQQIIKNLISNAIKFTEKGTVNLTVFNASKDAISFCITDTGIGIDTKDQKVIFEVFKQLDSSINRKYAGTGLGLSISNQLANLLGGNIVLTSQLQKGSKFTLTIPSNLIVKSENEFANVNFLNESEKFKQVIVEETSWDNLKRPKLNEAVKAHLFEDDRAILNKDLRKILIIDDDKDFAQILFRLGHELKLQCLVATGAKEGLNLALAYLPDAILLDMRLPDQSGLSVIQQLKDHPSTRHIPIHVISATDYSKIALQLGAVGYEIKPITKEKIVEIFKKLEDKITQKIKHVLLVEDDTVQRDALKKLIADSDVEVTAVASGAEAMTLLRNNVYECMIVDLKLPDMKGNELLEKMSGEEIDAIPPIIIYTGRDLSQIEEANLLKYSDSIIIKGARSHERLLDEVTLFLHKVESKLPLEQQNKLKSIRSRELVFEGRKVLIVDDDIRNIFALTSALEHWGFLVEFASSGLEAIRKLEEVEDIEIVLMDIMMPEMDGLEAINRLRNNLDFKKLPIIAITAKATVDDQEQCLAAGANDYLSKPIDLDRLKSVLRVWMPTIG